MLFALGKLGGVAGNAKFVATLLYNGVFIALVEVLTARNWRRYLTRVFLTDLSYLLFFATGLYYFFFSGPIQRAVVGVTREDSRLLWA